MLGISRRFCFYLTFSKLIIIHNLKRFINAKYLITLSTLLFYIFVTWNSSDIKLIDMLINESRRINKTKMFFWLELWWGKNKQNDLFNKIKKINTCGQTKVMEPMYEQVPFMSFNTFWFESGISCLKTFGKLIPFSYISIWIRLI